MEALSPYLDWNNRLAKYYFNEEMAGREVLIYANTQIINLVGEGLGNVEHFIRTVKDGPSWTTRSGLCQKALQAYEDWRSRLLEYPPYIAFLVLFVLAEDTEGDFAPHAYYPKLNRLLDMPLEQNSPPSFHRMSEIWADLEKWSKEDRHEELGRFVFRIRGEWRHVGLPLSQTLLSHNERENLKVIFNRAEIDPTDAPAVDIINRILLHYGSQNRLLKKRTLGVLGPTNAPNMALKNALLELVFEELADWDGVSPNVVQTDNTIIEESRTGLRICLHEDGLSHKFETYFRFKTNHKMPDTELNFISNEIHKTLTCYESNANWSSPLRDQSSSRSFDASSVSWTDGFQLKDTENNWRVKLKGASVRLFLPGKREKMPDWIESHHLERQTEFMVAAYSDILDKIRDWGFQSCENFFEKGFIGLPAGWNIFYGKNATRSCNGIDVLTLSDLFQMHLAGGIKTGRGNTYLKFGTPLVILDNVSGSEKVKINGSEIIRSDPNIPIWELPEGLPTYEPLRIEIYVDSSSDPLQTRIIRLEDPHLPVAFIDLPRRASDGDIITNDDSVNYAMGPIIVAINKKEYTTFSNALPTHLSSRIIFLGSRPGEIRDWPSEALPEDWHPVWASVQKGRKEWAAHFCGNSEHLKANHYPSNPIADRRSVNRWREAIWNNRKITRPPSLLFLSKIWKNYVEAARNA